MEFCDLRIFEVNPLTEDLKEPQIEGGRLFTEDSVNPTNDVIKVVQVSRTNHSTILLTSGTYDQILCLSLSTISGFHSISGFHLQTPTPTKVTGNV